MFECVDPSWFVKRVSEIALQRFGGQAFRTGRGFFLTS